MESSEGNSTSTAASNANNTSMLNWEMLHTTMRERLQSMISLCSDFQGALPSDWDYDKPDLYKTLEDYKSFMELISTLSLTAMNECVVLITLAGQSSAASAP